MKTLLTSPSKMSLSDNESVIYQNGLKQASELSLNLLAVKVTNRPSDFNGWCLEMIDVCVNRVNYHLLDADQLKPLKKLVDLLTLGVSVSQLQLAKISPWPLFVDFINQKSQIQGLEERTRLLNYVNKIKTTSLVGMFSEDKLAIAGKHTVQHDPKVYDFDCEWFGSTKGAKAFHQVLDDNSQAMEQALSHIPLEGEVTDEHYQAFVADYVSAHEQIEKKPALAPATRLLAMRRPDQFVVLTNAKTEAFALGLGIKRLTTNDFNSYWVELIGAVRSMSWWSEPAPVMESEVTDEQFSAELFYWQHRAILLDMMFFADSDTTAKSNYLKALKKPARAKTAATGGRRSKESARALVERVLATDDMPDFIMAQRESIISQVEAGKKIDDVIALLRKIFS
ncbi:MAG: hypothetical protein HRU22_03210 [Gammaproteobacteria bacterium]|nr:hypothetical protein [Gammaproteobacteria bacterium]